MHKDEMGTAPRRTAFPIQTQKRLTVSPWPHQLVSPGADRKRFDDSARSASHSPLTTRCSHSPTSEALPWEMHSSFSSLKPSMRTSPTTSHAQATPLSALCHWGRDETVVNAENPPPPASNWGVLDQS